MEPGRQVGGWAGRRTQNSAPCASSRTRFWLRGWHEINRDVTNMGE